MRLCDGRGKSKGNRGSKSYESNQLVPKWEKTRFHHGDTEDTEKNWAKGKSNIYHTEAQRRIERKANA